MEHFCLPAVTNHNLRGVLVGHHGCGARQSASMSVGMVRLQWLPLHACVHGWPRLEELSTGGNHQRHTHFYCNK